jgi:hypothetical protein
MRFPGWFICVLTVLVFFSAQAAEPVVSKARAVRERGDFKQAATVLNSALANKNLSEAERKQLSYEIDLLERIRKDFSLTKEQLFSRLEKAVRDITTAEFEGWLKEGRFENRTIDGTTYYSGTSVSNLFWRESGVETRRIFPRDKSAQHRAMLENARLIKQSATWNKPYVLPQYFTAKMPRKKPTRSPSSISFFRIHCVYSIRSCRSSPRSSGTAWVSTRICRKSRGVKR